MAATLLNIACERRWACWELNYRYQPFWFFRAWARPPRTQPRKWKKRKRCREKEKKRRREKGEEEGNGFLRSAVNCAYHRMTSEYCARQCEIVALSVFRVVNLGSERLENIEHVEKHDEWPTRGELPARSNRSCQSASQLFGPVDLHRVPTREMEQPRKWNSPGNGTHFSQNSTTSTYYIILIY